MKKTKIDWCDCTVNPVIGCKNGCAYCYAEKINKRFGFIPNWKEPQFFPERLKQLDSKTPKSIFMDSMSDVGLWSLAQIHRVAYSIKSNPQHNYLFLTKRPDLFIEKCKRIVEDANNGNIWVGVSANTRKDLVRLLSLPRYAHRFISIEPIKADGKIVGMVGGLTDYIDCVYVKPEYRRRGLARQAVLKFVEGNLDYGIRLHIINNNNVAYDFWSKIFELKKIGTNAVDTLYEIVKIKE